MSTHIRIFASGSSRKWGQGVDAEQIASVLRYQRLKTDRREWRIEHCDPMTWTPGPRPEVADLHIFNEVPARLAMPWARYNLVVVNPEWWPRTAWDWTMAPVAEGGMDLFVFKSESAAALFPEVPRARAIVCPWKSDMPIAFGDWAAKEDCMFYAIGGSANKAAAARIVVAGWQATWPPLDIWCTEPIAAQLRPLCAAEARITFQTEYRSAEEREARQRACRWHCVASVAEGYGYTMAEAAACGVPTLWCDLSVQRESWALTHGCIAVEAAAEDNGMRERAVTFRQDALVAAATALFAMTADDIARLQTHLREHRRHLQHEFIHRWGQILAAVKRGSHAAALPRPVSRGTMPPKVGIITVTRNRAAWWGNMIQNVMQQDWPVSRLEWILVDDGDEGQRLADRVAEFQARNPAITVRYVPQPSEPRQTIGAKRNAAVAAASTDIDMFVTMDDDDHYPASSVSTRVSWLTRANTDIAYCSVLPMYDVTRYISAMNVPPLMEAPHERVSEATLAFTREAWARQPFPDSSAAEGGGFLAGRVNRSVEIPPTGVIVSFIHKANTASRRVPNDQEPNGCHYGFSDAYFRYLHTIGMPFSAE